jgi:hypothetical protein
MDPFGHFVGLLGRGISPTQGHYLHRTTQHRKTWTYIHAPSRIRTSDPNVERPKTVHALDLAAIGTGCFGEGGIDGTIILKMALKYRV